MAGRRHHILAHRHTTRLGNLRRHLGPRQNTAVAGLGALRQLDLDHLDLRQARVALEQRGIKTTLGAAATKVARADLPDQITAGAQVVARDRAFAGVVIKAALSRPGVERQNGIGRQRAEAHGGDIEHADIVGLSRIGVAAHPHAEVAVSNMHRRQRVVEPLVALFIHAIERAEGLLVEHIFGALVNHTALLARERQLVGIGLNEILTQLRANGFEHVAKMRQHRVVATDGMATLANVPQAKQRQRQQRRGQQPPERRKQRQRQANQGTQHTQQPGQKTQGNYSRAHAAVLVVSTSGPTIDTISPAPLHGQCPRHSVGRRLTHDWHPLCFTEQSR